MTAHSAEHGPESGRPQNFDALVIAMRSTGPQHRDDLHLEDMPSRNPAAATPEPWWRPRYRAAGPAATPYGPVPAPPYGGRSA